MATRLRDLSITTKLGLGFGTVCLLLLAAIGLGLQTLHTSQATVSSMSDVVVPGVKYSGLVKYGVAQVRLDVTSMGLATDDGGPRERPDRDGGGRRGARRELEGVPRHVPRVHAGGPRLLPGGPRLVPATARARRHGRREG